jgi:hypothetical protein
VRGLPSVLLGWPGIPIPHHLAPATELALPMAGEAALYLSQQGCRPEFSLAGGEGGARFNPLPACEKSRYLLLGMPERRPSCWPCLFKELCLAVGQIPTCPDEPPLDWLGHTCLLGRKWEGDKFSSWCQKGECWEPYCKWGLEPGQ